MKKQLCIGFLLIAFFLNGQAAKMNHILVYTKNGVGYVHDNIPNAIHCFDSLSKVLKLKITKTADPAIFNDKDLKNIDLIIFASTNNDVFDTDEQRLAFRHYIEAGGSFFGIHSAVGTERKWTWFKQMMGGMFAWHPRFQSFDVVKLDAAHPAIKSMPARWTRQDECYFLKELFPSSHVISAVDLLSLHADSTDMKKVEQNKGGYERFYPFSWENNFDGGHILITTAGHDKNDYRQPLFTTYLKENIQYMLSVKRSKNFTSVHSKSIHDLPLNLK